MLKEVELRTRKMLRWKAVSTIATRYGAAHGAAIFRLQESAKFYRRRGDRHLDREKASRSESSDEGQSAKVRGPQSKCKRKKWRV